MLLVIIYHGLDGLSGIIYHEKQTAVETCSRWNGRSGTYQSGRVRQWKFVLLGLEDFGESRIEVAAVQMNCHGGVGVKINCHGGACHDFSLREMCKKRSEWNLQKMRLPRKNDPPQNEYHPACVGGNAVHDSGGRGNIT